MSQPFPAPLSLLLTTVHRIAAQVTAEPTPDSLTYICSTVAFSHATSHHRNVKSPVFIIPSLYLRPPITRMAPLTPNYYPSFHWWFFYKTALLGCNLKITKCTYFRLQFSGCYWITGLCSQPLTLTWRYFHHPQEKPRARCSHSLFPPSAKNC